MTAAQELLRVLISRRLLPGGAARFARDWERGVLWAEFNLRPYRVLVAYGLAPPGSEAELAACDALLSLALANSALSSSVARVWAERASGAVPELRQAAPGRATGREIRRQRELLREALLGYLSDRTVQSYVTRLFNASPADVAGAAVASELNVGWADPLEEYRK